MSSFIENNLWEIGIGLFCFYAAIILAGSFLSFRKAAKNSIELNRKDIYTLSMAFFFLLIAIGLIVRIYFLFFIAHTEEEFLLQILASERSAEGLPAYVNDGRLELIQLLWQIQVGFTTAGLACLMYGTEYQIIKQTKYSLTIIEIILAPLLIILPYEIAHVVYYATFIPPFVWIALYYWIARKTAGDIKKNALTFLIGFLFFFVGAALNSESARGILFSILSIDSTMVIAIFTCWISPLVMAFGFVLMLYGILKKI